MPVTLKTQRTILRQWQPQDFQYFADLNADKEVMRYFPKCLDRSESDALAERCHTLIEQQGWGFWALELAQTSQLMGFLGLHKPDNMPFSPCVEIGWRLGKAFWGNGYATEASHEVLKFAFQSLNLKEVVSFTTLENNRSRAVMERLGFTNTHRNFKHPALPSDHKLSEHVLYKLSHHQWLDLNK